MQMFYQHQVNSCTIIVKYFRSTSSHIKQRKNSENKLMNDSVKHVLHHAADTLVDEYLGLLHRTNKLLAINFFLKICLFHDACHI
jgi:hypothetical protein